MKERTLDERLRHHFERVRAHEAEKAQLDAELHRLLQEARRKKRPFTFAARASLRTRQEALTSPNIQRESNRLRKLVSRYKGSKRATTRHVDLGDNSRRDRLSGSSKKSESIAATPGEMIMGPNTPNPSYRRTERTVTVEHFYDDELPEDLQGLPEDDGDDDDELGPDDGVG